MPWVLFPPFHGVQGFFDDCLVLFCMLAVLRLGACDGTRGLDFFFDVVRCRSRAMTMLAGFDHDLSGVAQENGGQFRLPVVFSFLFSLVRLDAVAVKLWH